MFYFIILSVVSVTSIITLNNFKKGFILTIALRLLIPASVRLIGVGISLNTFQTFILFISFLLHKKYKMGMPRKLQLIIILFIASSLMLTPFALNMGVIEQIKKMFSFFMVDMILGILGWYAIEDNKDFQNLLKMLCSILFCVCIYGLYEYITKSNPYADWATETFGRAINPSDYFLTEKRGILIGRIMGTGSHPLTWGLLMSTFFAFIYNHRNQIQKRSYTILLLSLVAINTFLCGSRSALIMIGVYTIIRLLEKPKKIFKISILTFLILTCTINLLPKTEGTQTFIKTIESSIFFWNEKKSEEAGVGGSSVSMRLDQLIFSFYLIQDSFLTGNGYGFSDLAQDDTTGKYETMMGFESILFTKIVNQGILGLLFFFIFYLSLLRYTCKLIENRNEKYKMIALYITYLIGIIFTGLQNSFYLFFLLAIIEIKQYYLLYKKQEISN